MTATRQQVVQVGSSELYVSKIGLGGGPLGHLYTAISDEQAVETVHFALVQGITLFDTAPLYGAGLSERRLGQALAETPRDSFVLASKVGRLVTPTGKVEFNWTRDGILRSIEDSLKRLRMDRLDIAHMHDADNHEREALDVAFPVLDELRAQGVIQAIGAGMNQWQMLDRFAREASFDCFLLAGRYTLLEQEPLEFLSSCQRRGIGIFLGGVYNSGILATGARPGAKYNYADAPAPVLERVRRIEAVCARHGVSLQAAALQFPLAHPAVSALIVGALSPDEVAANLAAVQAPIPLEFWHELRSAGIIAEAAPLPQTPAQA